MERKKQPPENLTEEFSRQKAHSVQRPWGRAVLGVLGEQ